MISNPILYFPRFLFKVKPIFVFFFYFFYHYVGLIFIALSLSVTRKTFLLLLSVANRFVTNGTVTAHNGTPSHCHFIARSPIFRSFHYFFLLFNIFLSLDSVSGECYRRKEITRCGGCVGERFVAMYFFFISL